MFSSRGGRSNRGGFDARTKIEARRRAQHVQQKVAAVRRGSQNQQTSRRYSEGDSYSSVRIRSNAPMDLSVKLANSRRKRLMATGSGRGGGTTAISTKTLPNFKVVANAGSVSREPVINAVIKHLTPIERNKNLANIRRTIVNDRIVGGSALSRATATMKRRSAPESNISPMKRRRHASDDDDEIMEVEQIKRPRGGMGTVASALQRAQSQDSSSSTYRRQTGTMIADTMDSDKPARVPIRNRLSSPPRTSATTSAKAINGFRVLVTQLNHTVTSEDVKELFNSVGELVDAYLIESGLGEAIFVRKSDAERAVKEFNNRELDGIPMKCQLLSSPAMTSGKKDPKPTSTLSGRFRGADNGAELPAIVRGSGAKKNFDNPDPDRDVVSSVLFGTRGGSANGGSNQKVTFTVKV